VALTALGTTKDLPVRLRTLHEVIVAQPVTLALPWDYTPIKRLLAKEPRVAAQSTWLLELIAAVENRDRGACLSALDAVIAHQPVTPPS